MLQGEELGFIGEGVAPDGALVLFIMYLMSPGGPDSAAASESWTRLSGQCRNGDVHDVVYVGSHVCSRECDALRSHSPYDEGCVDML